MPGGRLTLRARLRRWALAVRRDVFALGLAARHPDVPWTARLLAAIAVAYALSPIDLIPDFVPVLGYLDDLLLVPALVWLTVRLVPGDAMTALRAEADALIDRPGPGRLVAATVIVGVWIGLAAALGWWAFGLLGA